MLSYFIFFLQLAYFFFEKKTRNLNAISMSYDEVKVNELCNNYGRGMTQMRNEANLKSSQESGQN